MRRDDSPTLTVRTKLNNLGRPIHTSTDALEAFWGYFTDSRAVDQNGAPVVVYHGTQAPPSEFNTDAGKGKTHGTGAFFSSNPAVASTYSGVRDGGAIVPAYLNLRTPVIVHAAGANWNRLGKSVKIELPAAVVSAQEDEQLLADLFGRPVEQGVKKTLKARKTTLGRLFPGELVFGDDYSSTDDLARWARKQGYDGIIIRDVVDHGPEGTLSTDAARIPSDLYVAFSPIQIKSAISNLGTYSLSAAHITDGHELEIGVEIDLSDVCDPDAAPEEESPRRRMRP
jgi:hypothetical protein